MRPIPRTSAYRTNSKLLETDRDRRTMFKMGAVHARDNNQGVSGAESERKRTARYQDLLYARIRASYYCSHRNRPRDLLRTRKEVRGVGVPAYSTKTLDSPQVNPKSVAAGHLRPS